VSGRPAASTEFTPDATCATPRLPHRNRAGCRAGMPSFHACRPGRRGSLTTGLGGGQVGPDEHRAERVRHKLRDSLAPNRA